MTCRMAADALSGLQMLHIQTVDLINEAPSGMHHRMAADALSGLQMLHIQTVGLISEAPSGMHYRMVASPYPANQSYDRLYIKQCGRIVIQRSGNHICRFRTQFTQHAKHAGSLFRAIRLSLKTIQRHIRGISFQ